MIQTQIVSRSKLFMLIIVCLLQACEDDNATSPCQAGKDVITTSDPSLAQSLFISSECSTIEFGAGTFSYTTELSINGRKNLVIQGAGRGVTILDFSGQTSGANGIWAQNVDEIIFKDFTIKNTPGDGLRVSESKNVTFDNVGVIWDTPLSTNGGYGLYPVTSENVTIKNCYVTGASDAGIYVGQTTNAIVSNNEVTQNVSGIEIENTSNADVFDNDVHGNTSGILVFDLQDLPVTGSGIRVFDNTIEDNNLTNFAPPAGIISEVPAGTGFLTLATQQVEVFNNTFKDNHVAGAAIMSYVSVAVITGRPITDPGYDPFFHDIHIHDNTFSKSGSANTTQPAFGSLLLQFSSVIGMPVPDILTDGIFDPTATSNGGICLQNNAGASFVNLDLMNYPSNVPSFDGASHDCSMPALPVVGF